MTTKDNNKDKITISKRTLILSLVIVVSLSVFLIVSGPLSSSLLLSPIKVRAQQQPTSQPSSQPQQPTSRPQQPSSSSSSPSSSTTTTLSPSTSGGSVVSPQAKGGGGGGGGKCAAGQTFCPKNPKDTKCVTPGNSNTCGATCTNPNGVNCNNVPHAHGLTLCESKPTFPGGYGCVLVCNEGYHWVPTGVYGSCSPDCDPGKVYNPDTGACECPPDKPLDCSFGCVDPSSVDTCGTTCNDIQQCQAGQACQRQNFGYGCYDLFPNCVANNCGGITGQCSVCGGGGGVGCTACSNCYHTVDACP